ncbi:CLUMA_CG012888, isoform A [Clunio marinus]|uniref:CLUMA_CG012888, isoform A n=1 Tax=Clunio marinus TaxID=568069 RepID=A0A1J1IH37_9DIPT|nr:CLUMA_CG012888, isoform A [Clunio marinus]
MNKLMTLEAVCIRRCVNQTSVIFNRQPFHVDQQKYQKRFYTPGGFWNSVSSSVPVTTLQEGITHLHDITGLPWWGTIVVSTVLLRTVLTFPLAIYQSKILAKVEKIRGEMPEIVKELKMETAYAVRKFHWNEKQARIMYNRSVNNQWNNLVVRDNCHPGKSIIVVLFQIPLWISQSWAIRNLIHMLPDPTSVEAQLTAAEMLVGGFGWIPNLTEADHSLILPVTLGVLNLTIIELQKASKKVQLNTKLQKYATNFFRVLSVLMVPIAAYVPSGLCLYWVASSSFGLVQNLVLLSPRLKRFANIPKVDSEVDKPYTFLLNNIKGKFSK